MSRTGFWAILTSALALDQIIKAWIRGTLAEGQSLDGPWPGVFEIKHITNEGIAFGMFQGKALLLTPIAVIIAAFAIYYSHTHRRESRWTHVAMAFLAAGALGNLYDRVFRGGVTDMYWFRAVNFPVFNTADVWITLATAIFVIKWGAESFRPDPRTQPRPTPAFPEPICPAPETSQDIRQSVFVGEHERPQDDAPRRSDL